MTKDSTIGRAKAIIAEHVWASASALIDTLAQEYGDDTARAPLADQAYELTAPVLDFESAAIEAGWTRNEHNGMFVAPTGHDPRMADYDDWQELCDVEGIEPYEREVYEHWIVSHWLGERLAAKGEKVDFDFAGLVIWARTTTGHAICTDHVIQQIAEETYL